MAVQHINLLKGWPCPSLLPVTILADAHAEVARELAAVAALPNPPVEGDPLFPVYEMLSYQDHTRGQPQIVEEMARFVNRMLPKEMPAKAGNMLLCAGCSQGIDMVASLLCTRGDVILVEAPCYFLICTIFASHGLTCVGVETDEGGLIPESVSAAVLQVKAEGKRPRMVYTVPSNNNPKGTTLSADRRRQLVSICQENDMLVLADEVYHILDWTESDERPHRMVCYDPAYGAEVDAVETPRGTLYQTHTSKPKPVVVSVCSLSKMVCPGMRLGWIEAAPSIICELGNSGLMASGGCITTTNAHVAFVIARDGRLDKLVESLRATYKRRSQLLVDALAKEGLAQVPRPTGGYFLWLPCAPGVTAAAMKAACAKEEVNVLLGTNCTVPGTTLDVGQAVRLCFAYAPEDQLAEAARRVGVAARACKSG